MLSGPALAGAPPPPPGGGGGGGGGGGRPGDPATARAGSGAGRAGPGLAGSEQSRAPGPGRRRPVVSLPEAAVALRPADSAPWGQWPPPPPPGAEIQRERSGRRPARRRKSVRRPGAAPAPPRSPRRERGPATRDPRTQREAAARGSRGPDTPPPPSPPTARARRAGVRARRRPAFACSPTAPCPSSWRNSRPLGPPAVRASGGSDVVLRRPAGSRLSVCASKGAATAGLPVREKDATGEAAAASPPPRLPPRGGEGRGLCRGAGRRRAWRPRCTLESLQTASLAAAGQDHGLADPASWFPREPRSRRRGHSVSPLPTPIPGTKMGRRKGKDAPRFWTLDPVIEAAPATPPRPSPCCLTLTKKPHPRLWVWIEDLGFILIF
jgi:hypothetical protein